MAINISKEARQQAISSIERYFDEQLEQRIGNIAAAGLMSFFLEELGPLVYNQAVADVQERLQSRVSEPEAMNLSHNERLYAKERPLVQEIGLSSLSRLPS